MGKKKNVVSESESEIEQDQESGESGEAEQDSFGESQESEQSLNESQESNESAEDILINSLKDEHREEKQKSLEGSMIDSDILKQIIERDSTQMNTILDEYQKAMDQV